MSYLSQAKLGENVDFSRRCRSALTNQSQIFVNDARADIKALAGALLTNETGPTLTFLQLLAASPGFDTTAEIPDGGIDSSLIGDADILASVQTNFPAVAALYFNPDGAPR